MNALVPVRPARPLTPSDTANPVVPLGTAAWYRADGPVVRPFARGDFWLGRLVEGKAIGFHDDRHVFLCANTRGGKGISVIIPNLCMWPGSAVVIDTKGENAMVTARVRGRGSRYCYGWQQRVRLLDPFNTVCTPDDDFSDIRVCFNPLDAIDPTREESVDEAGRIADAQVVTEATNDPFWDESSRTLIKFVILHVATWRDFLPEERNLITVRRLITAGDTRTQQLARMSGGSAPSGFRFLFDAMSKNKAFGGVIANAGEMFANLERNGERTFASIVQVACANTDYIDSPAMQRCLVKSDFALSELKTNPKGTSLYLCLPQRFMETHFRWLRMMVTLTLTEMERQKQRPASNYPVLMVLDEFPALRRMRVVENAAAQIAGFGVKMVFVVQTLAQLKDLYRDNWETFVANAGVKLFFCNDDHFTRQYVSQLVGDCEVVRTVRSFNETAGTSSSESESQTIGTSVSHTSGSSTTHSGADKGSSSSSSQSTTVSHSVSMGRSKTLGASHSTSGGYSETIQKRALVTPDEVGRLFGDRDNPAALLLISGYQPIFLKRTFYFHELPLFGYFDWHADHPKPLTIPQAEARRAQVKREQEMAVARAKAARETQERAEAARKAREEESKRLKIAEREWARIEFLENREEERQAQQARVARRWMVLKTASYWSLFLIVCAYLGNVLGPLLWRILFFDRRYWPWWAEDFANMIDRMMQ
ncbi:MAG: hypothetical protein QOI12_167 [Alphaproteobacteria bacterium]|jgi:type IV secretory pathway TraG/TraD family ATPase VirD4|nr:hypothetical protein [Alphaproteobacteria bacterium]